MGSKDIPREKDIREKKQGLRGGEVLSRESALEEIRAGSLRKGLEQSQK